MIPLHKFNVDKMIDENFQDLDKELGIVRRAQREATVNIDTNCLPTNVENFTDKHCIPMAEVHKIDPINESIPLYVDGTDEYVKLNKLHKISLIAVGVVLIKGLLK